MEDKPAAAAAPLIDLTATRTMEPDEGAFEAYANILNFNWTLTDVRLVFGELVHWPPDDASESSWANMTPMILERAKITIPWAQAKVLATALGALVRKYEELNGEIKDLKLPS